MKFLILGIIISLNAFAFKIGTEESFDIKVNKDDSSVNFQYDFEGIVSLSNCSGSLIQFSGQPDTANAIVMTNGHCVQKWGGYLKPGEVWFNKRVNRSMKIFTKGMRNTVRVKATKVLFATMTDTDVAYYELRETYQDIKAKGIEPFLLDTNRPHIGMNIDIVSGYWKRGYRCHIDAFAFELLEGDWTFVDALRYSDQGCKTKGGTSGAPVIQTGTRVAVAVNNTGNMNGGHCTLNNPCERDDEGGIQVLKRSYGQQTYNVYSCLTPDFQIDLEKESCNLPK